MDADTLTTTTAPRARKGAIMATTLEQDVRAFAAEFPGPNTVRMVELCEQGAITWAQAYSIARDSLREGLKAVAA